MMMDGRFEGGYRGISTFWPHGRDLFFTALAAIKNLKFLTGRGSPFTAISDHR